MQQLYLNNFFYKDPTTGEFVPIAGIAGESAYEIAVRLGTFTGTEEEWNNALETERAAAVASIQSAGETAKTDAETAIDTKAKEALATIPEDYTDFYNETVKITEQALTDEQKAQARENIGAASKGNYANAIERDASGYAVQISDISPIPHTIKIKAECPIDIDPTSITIRICESKNLIYFPYDLQSGTTKSGITATIQEDGGVVFNGTSTVDTWWQINTAPVAAEIIDSYSKYDAIPQRFVTNMDGDNATDYNKSGSWYVRNTGAHVYIMVKPGTYENLVVYPQIEVGTTSTEYQKGTTYQTVSLDENGCCECTSASPLMTIWATESDILLNVVYEKNINDELASIKPNARLEEYGMPILYVNGDVSRMTRDNKVTLSYKYENRQGTCTMKWQGSSSTVYPKKNYTINFDAKFEAKDGWGEQKKYCLKANWVDTSHARNIVSARIWGDFVRTRTNPNERLLELPNCGAIDGFPIIIVLNGEFHGLYTFNIPKDGWMFGMGEGTREAILCADSLNDGTGACAFKEEATLDGDFEVEYATDEDDTDWIKTSINTLINTVMNATSVDDLTTISNYIDIDSAIDYYLHTVFTHGIDNFSRNYLLATYDGVKWYFTGYDMDLTFGLTGRKGFIYQASIGSNGVGSFADMHALMNYIWTYHRDLLKNRYLQLRQLGYPLYEDAPSKTAIMFIQDIPQGVYNKDQDRWHGLSYSAVNNYHQISEFMRQRFKYMDFVLGT